MSSFVFEELEAHGEIVGLGNTPAERAARIVAEAEAHAAEIETEARRAGYEAGYAEGLAQAARAAREPSAKRAGWQPVLLPTIAARHQDPGVDELFSALAERGGLDLRRGGEKACQLVVAD